MIFGEDMVAKIRAGEKTQTRRLVKDGERVCRYRPGRTYTVQPKRGKRGIATLIVTSIRQESLHDISEADARAEGFPDREAFFHYWLEVNGKLTDEPVWVITFTLGQVELPRYLADVRKGRGDYTTLQSLAMPGEPECVSELDDTDLLADATERWEQHQAERARDRAAEARGSLQHRIRQIKQAGKDRNVDVSSEVRVLQRQHDALSRKLNALNRQIEQAERRLDCA